MSDSARAFFAMGGYGVYVWLAYGCAAVVLAWIWGAAAWARRREERALQRAREELGR